MNCPSLLTIRRVFEASLLAACLGSALPALAHGSKAGDISIEHPYAMPSPVSAPTTAAVHFRGLKNTGAQPERLLAASTPLAQRIEFRQGPGGGSAAGARLLDAVVLAPGAELKPRHDGDLQLRLIGLATPLKNGDEFPLTLRFERAGEQVVMVHVQQPKAARSTP